MSERVKRELTRDLIAGIARTGPVWRNMPVNACPDDDPVGEPRPLVATPVNDVSALIDYLIAAGWRKEQGARDAWPFSRRKEATEKAWTAYAAAAGRTEREAPALYGAGFTAGVAARGEQEEQG